MAASQIQLSDHFTLGKLVKFTLPSIVMMIVTSLYCVVDGIFVANYRKKVQLLAFVLKFDIFAQEPYCRIGHRGAKYSLNEKFAAVLENYHQKQLPGRNHAGKSY